MKRHRMTLKQYYESFGVSLNEGIKLEHLSTHLDELVSYEFVTKDGHYYSLNNGLEICADDIGAYSVDVNTGKIYCKL